MMMDAHAWPATDDLFSGMCSRPGHLHGGAARDVFAPLAEDLPVRLRLGKRCFLAYCGAAACAHPAPRKAEVGYAKTDDGLEVDFLARHPAAGDELV